MLLVVLPRKGSRLHIAMISAGGNDARKPDLSKPNTGCCRSHQQCKCGQATRLTSVLIVSFVYAIVEVVVGIKTGAMTLTSDAFHMFSDVLAQLVALVCLHVASKPSKKNTYGWARAEVLGALINASFLISLMMQLINNALDRIIHPIKVHNPPLLLAVGACGLLLNIFGLALLGGHGHSHGGNNSHKKHNHGHGPGARHSHLSRVGHATESMQSKTENPSQKTAVDLDHRIKFHVKEEANENHKKEPSNMNIRGVVLHLVGDAVGSVIVVISAALIWKWNEKPWTLYIDPCLTLCSVILIVSTTIPLLRVSSLILLQSVPGHISLRDLRSRLLKDIDGVVAVHELHIWELSVLRAVATAHLHVSDYESYGKVAADVKEFFHNEGIHSTTIQPEFGLPLDNTCLVKCPPNCAPLRCCSAEMIQEREREDAADAEAQ